MKLTCIIEKGKAAGENPIITGAKGFSPKADVTVSEWWLDGCSSFAEVSRIVETEGPDKLPIPAGFTENPDTGILIGSFCPFGGAGMDAFENLGMIGVCRAGLENMNVDAATERGIAVVNAIGRNADSVSDLTMGMILAAMRDIALSHNTIMNGGWEVEYCGGAPVWDMRGKTVGLFGFGYIGKLMAEKLSGFKVNLIVYDPFVSDEAIAEFGGRKVEKDELFKEADIISVHARYIEGVTDKVIGRHEIDLMKPTARFVNTARAALVDYDALCDALEERRIAAAALDVFYDEPLPADDRLRKLDNVTMTCHIAGRTVDASLNTARLIYERMHDIIAGKPTAGFVNPQVLENPRFQAWLKAAKEEFGW